MEKQGKKPTDDEMAKKEEERRRYEEEMLQQCAGRGSLSRTPPDERKKEAAPPQDEEEEEEEGVALLRIMLGEEEYEQSIKKRKRGNADLDSSAEAKGKKVRKKDRRPVCEELLEKLLNLKEECEGASVGVRKMLGEAILLARSARTREEAAGVRKAEAKKGEDERGPGKPRCKSCLEEVAKERRAKEVARIKGVLNKGGGLKEFASICKLDWPEEVYTSISTVEMSMEGALAVNAVCVMGECKDEGKTPLQVHLQRKNPQVWGLLKELTEEGEAEYVAETFRTSRNATLPGRVTFLVREGKEAEATLRGVANLQKSMAEARVNEVVVLADEGVDAGLLRKALEFSSSTGETKVRMVMGARGVNGQTRSLGVSESLIIRTGGKSYSDILRDLKSKVDTTTLGGTVASVRKTAGGDVVVRMKGKADALKKVLEKESLNVRLQKREAAFIVSDLDPSVAPAELSRALGTATGIPVKDLEVKAIREVMGGTQVAVVAVPPSRAETMRAVARVRVGWVECRVRERMNPVRCFRCLGFGHLKRECKGPDRSKACLSCTKEGHRATECKGEAFCLACDAPGHRMDSTRCPLFRDLVMRGRNP